MNQSIKYKHLLLTLAIWLVQILPLAAHGEESDFMRSKGKIYVVVAVIIAVFLGIVLFLEFLERRLSKLENQIQDHESTTSR